MPSIPGLYKKIRDSLFYEDLITDEQFARDFLIPFRYLDKTKLGITEHLDLGTFYGIWRYLQFFSLVDIALSRVYGKDDSTILLNSLVRATDYESMVQLPLLRFYARMWFETHKPPIP